MKENFKNFKTKCDELDSEIKDIYVDINNKAFPIIDGIMDIEKYINSKLKIMWILKEPYDGIDDEGNPCGDGWYYSDLLTDKDFRAKIGRANRTWNPIIYTSYGLLNDFLDYQKIIEIAINENIDNVLSQISVININKLPGKKTSRYSFIKSSYNKYKDILLKQIELYNPDIIIGAYTMRFFYKDLDILEEDINKTDFESLHYTVKNNKIFIAAYHPASRRTETSKECYVNDIIKLVKTKNSLFSK